MRFPIPRRLLLALSVALATILLAAPLSMAASGSNFNGTDAAFAAMMLPHHQGGVKLGRLAASKGTTAQIRKLGRGIVSAQSREAKTLARMVKEFKTTPSTTKEIEQRAMMDMRTLSAASGSSFDRQWLNVISAHHMAAIQMAQMEQRGGTNSAAESLARKIIATQRHELAQFNTLSKRLGS